MESLTLTCPMPSDFVSRCLNKVIPALTDNNQSTHKELAFIKLAIWLKELLSITSLMHLMLRIAHTKEVMTQLRKYKSSALAFARSNIYLGTPSTQTHTVAIKTKIAAHTPLRRSSPPPTATTKPISHPPMSNDSATST
jgi:hypothetical protein